MKYKCLTKCFVNDVTIMSPGDIVVIEGDQFYNVSTGVDYKKVPDMDRLKSCLEAITDEYPTVPKGSLHKAASELEKFKAITKNMADTFEKKNHDYGNSFEQSLNEFGLIASAIRIGDKMNRFKSLTKKAAMVEDESLRDTLLDMANYAILTVMWLDKLKCGSDGR